MVEKSKRLVLKKAYFDEGFNGSMEQIVSGVSQKLPNHEERIFNPELFKSHLVAKIENGLDGKGLFVQIFEYEKGATGLINLENSLTTAELEELLPPEKRQFLGDEVILYVRNNHILACNLGNRDTLVQNIFGSLGEKSGVVDGSLRMKVSDVPNKTELKRAREIGIKRIELGIDGYLASVEEFHHKSSKEKVLEKIFGTPDDAASIRKRANTHGKLVLNRSRFKKEEIKKDEWLTSVGETIIQSDADDYIITLEDNTRISTAKLKVSKSVKLKKFGNSISYTEAKAALLQFYEELHNNGSLDW